LLIALPLCAGAWFAFRQAPLPLADAAPATPPKAAAAPAALPPARQAETQEATRQPESPSPSAAPAGAWPSAELAENAEPEKNAGQEPQAPLPAHPSAAEPAAGAQAPRQPQPQPPRSRAAEAGEAKPRSLRQASPEEPPARHGHAARRHAERDTARIDISPAGTPGTSASTSAAAAAAHPAPAPSPVDGRAQNFVRLGIAAERAGRLEEAIAAFREALSIVPDYPDAQAQLVRSLVAARHFDQAIPVLEASIARFDTLSSRMLLARIRLEQGQPNMAWQALLPGLPQASANAEYQAFAGAVLRQLKAPGDAVERYRAATRLSPSVGRYWIGLGLAEEEYGNVQAAKTAYRNALACPDLPPQLRSFVAERLQN
jgi:tetratricopeptide (TPR) repeat protein